jgi:O-antigen/teichoic acid export membrane protein
MNIDRRNRKYIRDLLLTTVFGGVIGFINYLFNIFIARFTNESIFALYTTAIGLIYLIQIPAISIQNILTKSVGETKNGDVEKFKWSSVVLFTVIGSISSLLFLLIIPSVTSPSQVSPQILLPLTITLLLAFLSPVTKGILLGKEKIVSVNIILLVETLLRFSIGYIGIKMGGNIELLILANAIPSFLSVIAVLPFIKSKKEEKTKIKFSFIELILMTVSLLLLSAPYTLDLILTPQAIKGEYGALSLIGKLVYFSCITIATVMFARLSNQKDDKKEIKTVGIAMFITFIIGIGMSLAIFLFKDLILELAFAGRYTDISSYFFIFGLAMAAYATVYMLANFFFSRNSYMYIFILLFITLLQVFLFRVYATDFLSVVRIQMIVYSLLLFLTLLYFLFNFIFKKNAEKVKEDI